MRERRLSSDAFRHQRMSEEESFRRLIGRVRSFFRRGRA